MVYEHFGGKEGLYQVIVDREVTVLSEMLTSQMRPGLHPREMLEHIVLSLLFYVLLGLHIWAGIHFGLRWFS